MDVVTFIADMIACYIQIRARVALLAILVFIIIVEIQDFRRETK
jgi:hypothetical protein